MFDITLLISGTLISVLILSTVLVAREYYKQLGRAQKEYEKARDSVEDITLSFNRELRREAERIQNASNEAELATSKADAGLKMVEDCRNRVAPLEEIVVQIGTQFETLDSAVKALSEINMNALKQIASIDPDAVANKMSELEKNSEEIKTRIRDLEDKILKIATIPESRLDATLPVIPIKRDKALASLTLTEVSVLEFLSSEGPKTAPEIKERVKLSREHTARLMKKLYEEGYLERETNKLPFRYSVKKEMESLLRRTETQIG